MLSDRLFSPYKAREKLRLETRRAELAGTAQDKTSQQTFSGVNRIQIWTEPFAGSS